jgi:pimeloyl-ACP methyl ester carboxylesterase
MRGVGLCSGDARLPNARGRLRGNVAFTDAGTGHPIVLVHGFPLDARVWDDIVPLLVERHRVIVPDLPGFGRSTIASSSFTMDSLAASLLALLDSLKIGRALFAGLSMGGYVIQSLVRRRPRA